MSYNITLPSNVCLDMFKNTPSDYITKLAQHLHLDGQWLVGLTEIHIPCTWYNITQSNNFFSIGSSTIDKTSGEYISTTAKCRLKEGFYATPEDIVSAINACIVKRSKKQEITFHYLRESKRIAIKFANRYQTFHFHSESKLAETLGFKTTDFYNSNTDDPKLLKDTIVAAYPPDMTGGVNGIYIYTDIVEHQYVGDKMAPLLRVVPVDRITGKTIYHIYEKPNYIPVTRQRIDTIELHLRTDFGEPLVFESGKVLVKLHFKRITA